MSHTNLLIGGERRLATEMRDTQDANGNVQEEHYQQVAPVAIGEVPKLLSSYLDLRLDGSSTPVTASIAPSSSSVYRLNRLTFLLSCTGSLVMTSFGSIGALTNGIKLEWLAGSVQLLDLLAGRTIKTLDDLVGVGRLDVRELGSSHTVQAIIDLPTPLRLDGAASESFRATVQDNLAVSGVVACRLWAMGSSEDLT